MPKPSKTADLLKVLGMKSSGASVPSPAPTESKPTKTEPSTLAPASKKPRPKAPEVVRRQPTESTKPASTRGRAVQFYVHGEDEKLIRDLAVWLAPHRKRVNDSLVIKAALRMAKTGPEFLRAYDNAIKTDGRTREKREKKSSETPGDTQYST